MSFSARLLYDPQFTFARPLFLGATDTVGAMKKGHVDDHRFGIARHRQFPSKGVVFAGPAGAAFPSTCSEQSIDSSMSVSFHC
jgi:hypothetical protein